MTNQDERSKEMQIPVEVCPMLDLTAYKECETPCIRFEIQYKEFLKLDRSGISVNRENFPDWKPDDFVKAFIEIMERNYSVKFENEEEPCDEEVILKFKLPMARHEANLALKGSDYAGVLRDIHEKCRSIWKYKENATEEEIKLAEEIGDMVCESGVFED